MLTPRQEWWTADEIAASGLPDLPATKRGVNTLAERQGWRAAVEHARRRKGRGGGWEYHWRLFPSRAQQRLLAAAAAPNEPERPDRETAWAWFDALPEKVKVKAGQRHEIIRQVEALEPTLGRDTAVNSVARVAGIGARTIWSWLSLIEGVRSDDRLPYLAPRHRAVAKNTQGKGFSPEWFAFLKSDFLRLEQPSFAACYRRSVRVASKEGWEVLPERTARRRFDAAVSKPVQVLCRKGETALKRLYPPQVRDKTAMVPLEAINLDFHRFDVFVRWPAERGQEAKIVRPQMVAFQDIYSGRVLAWRVDQTPNSTAVQLCAGDMIETWGIPHHVLMDNGRENAAKLISGGVANRYRFKVREDDVPGLFTALGCEIHWATPYAGQSKPIERAFRDMCDAIAKDPRFAGAWTGNRPEAKPENYGSKAIPLDTFLAVLAEGIEEHNTRQGRRSEVAWGRSFAEVFDEAYAAAPIRKATEAQRRLWLMGAEGKRTDTRTGQLRFQGNTYWADWMHEIAGERVVIRFDPADFHSGLHVYSQDNAYLGHAPCHEKTGFFAMEEARTFNRARRSWVKAEKAAAEAHREFSAAELGTALDASAPSTEAAPDARVVRPIFGKAGKAAKSPSDAGIERAQAAMITDLAARRPQESVEETPRERFRRALELERRIEQGDPATAEQRRWLGVYQSTPEYRAERMLWDELGDAIFG